MGPLLDKKRSSTFHLESLVPGTTLSTEGDRQPSHKAQGRASTSHATINLHSPEQQVPSCRQKASPVTRSDLLPQYQAQTQRRPHRGHKRVAQDFVGRNRGAWWRWWRTATSRQLSTKGCAPAGVHHLRCRAPIWRCCLRPGCSAEQPNCDHPPSRATSSLVRALLMHPSLLL